MVLSANGKKTKQLYYFIILFKQAGGIMTSTFNCLCNGPNWNLGKVNLSPSWLMAYMYMIYEGGEQGGVGGGGNFGTPI